ncbi:MAG: hypothetical protein O2816_04570 [Planctomycetota bacterium]|nr:hypothetical protein [Planctomycetota bacterium]
MGALIPALLLVLAAASQDDPWAQGEAWRVAQDTTADPARRVTALVAAIEEVAGDAAAAQPRLVLAFEEFQREHDRFEGARATALARAMHRAAGATWSAYCLEGILRRTGDYRGAQEVLVAHLAGLDPGPERTDVVQRSAIVAAGAGWLEQERAALGRALVHGGTDAHQMLGRLALAAGRTEEARRLFRVLLEQHAGDPAQTPPWALRGWGLALLPPAADPLRRSPR